MGISSIRPQTEDIARYLKEVAKFITSLIDYLDPDNVQRNPGKIDVAGLEAFGKNLPESDQRRAGITEVVSKTRLLQEGMLLEKEMTAQSPPVDMCEIAEWLLGDDYLRGLPFGGHLVASMNFKDTVNDYDQRLHVVFALSATFRFFNGSYEGLLRPNYDDEDKLIIKKAIDGLLGVSGVADESFGMEDAPKSSTGKLYEGLRSLVWVMVLYHDIGKSMGKENHPVFGYEILRDNSEQLVLLVSASDQEMTDLLLTYVRYHDLWGNITTGESGLPLLSLVLDPTASAAHAHLKRLLLLLFGNLADSYGVVRTGRDGLLLPKKLGPMSIRRVARELRELNGTFKPGPVNEVGQLWTDVVRIASRGPEPITRLCLLIRAGVEGDESQAHGSEDDGDGQHRLITFHEVSKAFRALPNRVDVTRRFATVRLAYALKFITVLGQAVAAGQIGQGPGERGRHIDYTDLIDRVCDIIAELCVQYSSQIEYYANQNVVTVFELSKLAPFRKYPTTVDELAEPKARFTKMLVDSVFCKPRGLWLSRILDLVSLRPGR